MPIMENPEVIIVGGGAAGIFAAAIIAEAAPDLRVQVIEKAPVPLAKVRLSGGGRCNLTHDEADIQTFVQNFPRGRRELIGPFNRFGAAETMRWFESHGVPLVTLEADWSFKATAITALRDTLSLSAGLSFNPDAWIPNSRKDLELLALKETEARLAQKLVQDRRNARDEVDTVLLDLELAKNGLALAEGQVSLSERIYARTKEAWERGSATGLELEDAQYAVDSARQSLISSRYQYLSLILDLGYALNVDWRTLAR